VPHPSPGRPTRVLFLNWRDTSHPEGGGSEVYAEHVCDGLAGLGHEVTLLTARYDGSAEDEVRPSGVRVVRLGGRLGVYARAAWAVRSGRVPRPDVVVETQNGIPYLAALWAPRTPHLVLVHHVHREQWPVVFGPVLARVGWFIESRVAPRVNRRRPYVAVSEVTRDELAELGVDRDRVRVIHNGALPPPPHDVRRSAEPQLLVLGRLVPHKRVEVALEVMARLRVEFPTARLVVAGRGWWEAEVRAEVERLGLEDVVDVVGFVSTAERHRLLASSWVSLVPSVKEGWGLVVVEAGMHATPTIAFRGTGGITESIVDGETGYLAEADDVADFTELTRRLLLDEAERERLGKAAEEFASGFTWGRTVERFDEAIREASARRVGATGRGRVGPRGQFDVP
jgi:glycosyltransferase involved in cell wall biosynthesis